MTVEWFYSLSSSWPRAAARGLSWSICFFWCTTALDGGNLSRKRWERNRIDLRSSANYRWICTFIKCVEKPSALSSPTPKLHQTHWLNHFWSGARSKTGEVLLITKIPPPPPNRGASRRRRSIHWILWIALERAAHCSTAWHRIEVFIEYLPRQQQKRVAGQWGVVCHIRRCERGYWVGVGGISREMFAHGGRVSIA